MPADQTETFAFDGRHLAAIARRCGVPMGTIAKCINDGTLRQSGYAGPGKLSYRTADLDRIGRSGPASEQLTAAREALSRLSALIDKYTGHAHASPRMTLAAGAVVAHRTIKNASVGLANVQAIGKYLYEHADGTLTADPEGARRKLPIATDSKFLDTLLGACQDAGGKLKVRIDHSDSIEARVGFATNFRKDGDRVACDINVFDSSQAGDLVLEVARVDPRNVGLSIDFQPSYEVRDGVAYMRADSIRAVDVVDAGAITPNGL